MSWLLSVLTWLIYVGLVLALWGYLAYHVVDFLVPVWWQRARAWRGERLRAGDLRLDAETRRRRDERIYGGGAL